MKCFHPHTFQKLGFDVILKQTHDRAISREAREACLQITPITDPDHIQEALYRVREFKNLNAFDDPFPLDAFVEVGKIVQKLTVAGNWLGEDELFRLMNWLIGIQKVLDYLQHRGEAYPHLHALVHQFSFQNRLAGKIGKVINERGTLRDDASPLLKKIRREIVDRSSEIRSLLQRVLRKANENNWSVEKEVTIRDNRLVIPVRAEAKGRIPGFVHDVSQSGGTVFIEPSESLALNNRLRELQISERNEVVRILTEITEEVRQHQEELEAFSALFVELDIIRAKALLAEDLAAEMPYVQAAGREHNLREAYFPLLQLKARDELMQVVPMNLKMDPERRIVVISGPNAGGKSITLKTVGLLQLMLQSGFLVPVNERSVFRVFSRLFIDIGDEQSVDNDLSTYTSHLFQMRQMGDNMDQHSLFLIDEFGGGTDPRQGGAIAEAFLDRFVRQRAFGIITTHYGNLKDYAEVTPGVINAAMQFDTRELKPTYQLMEGVPGRSYAFEMAQRVGVHPTVLKRARKKVGTEEMDTERLLKKLEKKSAELNRVLTENKHKNLELKELVAKNEALKQELEQKRKKIVREAQVEARELIEQANKRIENTIREIKERQAEKKSTQKLRARLQASKPDPLPPVETRNPKEEAPAIQVLKGEPMQEGDWVKWKDSTNTGKLVEIQGKRALVEMGQVRLTVKLNQLEKIVPPKASNNRKGGGIRPQVEVKMDLNVMGMRVEEALPEVDKLLDHAMLAGLKWVRILHGKGTGVLRDAVRKHVRDFSFVKNVEDAPLDQGGAGWSIVEIK